MKKVAILSIILFTSVLLYGQDDIINREANILSDSLRKNFNRKEFKVSVQGEDSLFTYIPVETGQRADLSEKAVNNNNRSTKSISTHDLSFIPDTHILDTSKDIGEIEISQSTANGALIYTIPIDCYTNQNTPPPAVQLVYNSLSRNNLAGQGWQIMSGSAIKITNTTIYHDNRVEAGIKNINSAFSLDGNRLIYLSTGTSGERNYKTEFGHIKAVAYTANRNLTYFKVFNPDGSVGTYGYTDNTATKDSYPMTEYQDAAGNYINYTYSRANNTDLLTLIQYGGKKNTTVTHFAKIMFTYESRPDITREYIDGLECLTNKRLKQISTYFAEQLLKVYTLTYDIKTVSLLKKIDCESNGKGLNPLIFYYGKNNQIVRFDKSSTILSEYFENTTNPRINYNKTRFDTYNDSDGLIAYPDYSIYDVNKTLYRNGVPIAYEYGSRFSPTQKLLIYDNITAGISIPAVMATGDNFLKLLPADVDGDGIDEMVKMNYSLVNNSTQRITYVVYDVVTSLGASSPRVRYSFSADFGGVLSWEGLLSPPHRQYLLGDFLGNGKQNILSISYCKNAKLEYVSSWATLVDLEGRAKSPTHDKTCFNLEPEDMVYALDFDGDGKMDVCHISNSGTKVYTFNISGSLIEIASNNSVTLNTLKDREVFVSDINGDGKSDLLISSKKDDFTYQRVHYNTCMGCCSKGSHDRESADGSVLIYFCDSNGSRNCQVSREPVKSYGTYAKQWMTLYSTGQGFDIRYSDICYNEGGIKFVLQDMNGDMRPDLVVREGSSIRMYLTENGILKNSAESARCEVSGSSVLIPAGIHNGQNMRQLFCIDNYYLYPVAYSADQSEDQLLTGVINSKGIVAKHSYSNIKEPNNYYYTKGTKATYPYSNLNSKLHVFVGTDLYLNGNLNNSMYYQYTKGLIDLRGRGLMGFEQVIENDRIQNTSTTKIYNPLNLGELISEESPTEKIIYTYNTIIASNKITQNNLTKKTLTDKLRGFTVSSTYTHDTYGNITKDVTDFGSGITKTAEYSYHNIDAAVYKLSVLYNTKMTHSRNGSTSTERTSIPVFAGNSYLPIVTVKYVNDLQANEFYNSYQPNTYYIYEQYNKPYVSVNKEIKKYTYDSFGRIVTFTDNYGLTTTNTYDSRGRLISEKNHLNQITSYEYDNWGRIIKKTTPDGIIEATAYTWVTAPANALYSATTTITGKPAARIYYDALGRVVRSGEMRFDGNYMYADKVYDNKGNIQKESMPFKGTAPTLWNTCTYDAYNRLTAVNYASGKVNTYSYSGNSTTSKIDGITKTTTLNTLNEVISITDPAGTSNYVYLPNGLLSYVMTPPHSGMRVLFEYDSYLRKTKVNDLSLGSVTYTYDTAGNMSQETDARGNITKMTFDSYNRLAKLEVSGQALNYTYTTDNMLSTETSSNGTGKVYTYDNLLRLSSEKETSVDGKWLQKTYTYANGNIASKNFTANTGNIITENYTYVNGHLLEIKLNNTTSIWKINSENDYGSPTGITTGSLTRTYTFDVNGSEVSRIVKNGSTIIQNFGSSFNAQTGSLAWRKDNIRNIQENFTYDNLDRLTGFAGKTASYDQKGNITSISNVGTFEYGLTAKPFALTGVTPYGSEVPLRAQVITYNGMMRPNTITENGYVANFTYNAGGERVKMSLKKNNADELNRYYIGSQYEMETGVAGSKEKLYLGGDAYSAAAVYVKEGSGAWTVYYICRDYLGSITHVITSTGAVKQELSYDAWGRLLNPANQGLYAIGSEPALFLGRGYTGHEHLTMFGLINMNVRLYDPVLGRFLSPDPYIQDILLSQNHNRYSYCLNNPLKYTDENGEFFKWMWGAVSGFWKGVFRGENPFKTAWQGFSNAVKIDFGLFQGDLGQIGSRFTWELPQTMVGNVYSHYRNVKWTVDKVRYFDGATFLINERSKKKDGVTLGSYINMNIKDSYDKSIYEPEWNNGKFTIIGGDPMFMHEYGHYIQSQQYGWGYLFSVGIRSIKSAANSSIESTLYDENGNFIANRTTHNLYWTETNANRKAAEYFKRNYKVDWVGDRFYQYPF